MPDVHSSRPLTARELHTTTMALCEAIGLYGDDILVEDGWSQPANYERIRNAANALAAVSDHICNDQLWERMEEEWEQAACDLRTERSHGPAGVTARDLATTFLRQDAMREALAQHIARFGKDDPEVAAFLVSILASVCPVDGATATGTQSVGAEDTSPPVPTP